MLPKAVRLVEDHRGRGDTLLIITATNRFLTAPIAALFDVPHLIATEPEWVDGRYSGRAIGTPSFAGGKVTRLAAWLAEHGETLTDSWCYSDSHNDLPLLRAATHPVAVDPDAPLRPWRARTAGRSSACASPIRRPIRGTESPPPVRSWPP